MASTISASLTVTTSSTSARMTSQVSSPAMVTCWPSAIVLGTSTDTRSPARSERATSSPASGSTPTTRTCGRQRLDRRRHPGDQPAAADRDHHGVEVLDLGGELEPDGALAGHHERLVVGVHERQPALGGERAGERLAVVGVAVELDDLGAVALGGRALGRGRVARHEDRRPRAVLARGEGQRLGVVARGDRAHAVGTQRGHGVEGAAELEGAGALEVLGLQGDRGADPRVERARAQQGRAVRDAVEARGGRVHVVDRDRQRRGRGHCVAW